MVLLNSRITRLQETHLAYQFVNAFLDRIVQKVDYQGAEGMSFFQILNEVGYWS